MAKKNTSAKAEKKNALMEDTNLDSQEGVVREMPEDGDDDVIIAEPNKAGQLGAVKLPKAPARPATAKKDGEKAGSQPTKADFEGAHKALDLARELSERNVAREAEGDAKRTKRKLAAEETTKFMIPLGIGERHGAVETVTINGYRLSIKKGMLVEIPLSVANILMEHLNVRSEAAEKFDLHRDEATEEALG